MASTSRTHASKAVDERNIATLCPHCSLCCNGVLFADVELQRQDAVDGVQKLGIEVIRKGKKLAFLQPCSCLNGKLCKIYPDRPRRCRTFECGLLKKVDARQRTPSSALRIIAKTLRQAAEVRQLVRELGNTDETEPLQHRYSSVMSQPIDLESNPVQGARMDKLMDKMSRLMQLLLREFLS